MLQEREVEQDTTIEVPWEPEAPAARARADARPQPSSAPPAADRGHAPIGSLALLVVGAAVSLATGSPWFLAAALAFHAVAMVVLAGGRPARERSGAASARAPVPLSAPVLLAVAAIGALLVLVGGA